MPGILVLVELVGKNLVVITVVRPHVHAILAGSPRRGCLLAILIAHSQPGKLSDGETELGLCGSEGQRGVPVRSYHGSKEQAKRLLQGAWDVTEPGIRGEAGDLARRVDQRGGVVG